MTTGLEFDMILLPCEGDTGWIDQLLPKIKECLTAETIPKHNETCQYCNYRFEAVSADIKNKKSMSKLK